MTKQAQPGDDPDQVRAETGKSYELIAEEQARAATFFVFHESWEVFAAVLSTCCKNAHGLCKHKGWWTSAQDHIAIKAERVHAEVSELVDTFARGTKDEPDKDCPEFTKAEVEWADCLLRLMDLGARYGFRGGAVQAKFLFNTTRPIRHGGKAF